MKNLLLGFLISTQIFAQGGGMVDNGGGSSEANLIQVQKDFKEYLDISTARTEDELTEPEKEFIEFLGSHQLPKLIFKESLPSNKIFIISRDKLILNKAYLFTFKSQQEKVPFNLPEAFSYLVNIFCQIKANDVNCKDLSSRLKSSLGEVQESYNLKQYRQEYLDLIIIDKKQLLLSDYKTFHDVTKRLKENVPCRAGVFDESSLQLENTSLQQFSHKVSTREQSIVFQIEVKYSCLYKEKKLRHRGKAKLYFDFDIQSQKQEVFSEWWKDTENYLTLAELYLISFFDLKVERSR